MVSIAAPLAAGTDWGLLDLSSATTQGTIAFSEAITAAARRESKAIMVSRASVAGASAAEAASVVEAITAAEGDDNDKDYSDYLRCGGVCSDDTRICSTAF